MAKILCSLSGLQFKCEYVPLYLHSRESYHPIFDAPASELYKLSERYFSEQSLDAQSSYLLTLALLNSTGNVEFRTPAEFHAGTQQIVALHIAELTTVVQQLNSILVPSFHPAKFVISSKSGSHRLEQLDSWIHVWKQNLHDFATGYRQQQLHSEITHKENILERLVKDVNKDVRQYATVLSHWAALAGDFPEFKVSIEGKQEPISLSSYWQQIIVRACREEEVWSIRREDLQELIEHCEQNIPAGTIFSYKLMKVLRDAGEKQDILLDIGDWDIAAAGTGTTGLYNIIPDDDSILQANIKALSVGAPTHKPVRSEYRSEFEYIKALAKWRLAESSSSNDSSKE